VKWDWANSRPLVRLSGPGLFNLRLFLWSYLLLFIPQVLFDVVAYESNTWLWLPIWTSAHLVVGALAFFIRLLGLDTYLAAKPSLLINLSLASFLGAVRVILIGYVSFGLGLAPDFDLVARIISGVILGSILFIFLSSILSSNLEYQVALKSLLRTQSQLAGLRRAKQKEVADIERELESTTRSVIEPRLSEISKALTQELATIATKRTITKELRDLLDNQIKPLTARLRSTSKALASPKTFKIMSPFGLLKIPDRMKPDLALQPIPLSVNLAAVLPFSLYVFEGPQWIWLGFAITAVLSVTFWLVKIYFEPKLSIPTLQGIVVLLVFVILQANLGHLILSLFGFPEPQGTYISLTIFIAVFLTTTGFGLVATYEYNQETFLKSLAKNNRRLERELALLNQRLWVEKREWALRIHGSVQASLTAALARLSKSGPSSKEELRLIRQHIRQASTGLKSSTPHLPDLAESLRKIRATWKGIVKVDFNLKTPKAQLVLADKWASACANEIIKESVSNSFKHGKADQVKIRFEGDEAGFVEVVAEDNGRGLPNQFRPGLGSELLDEIAYPWSLTKIEGGVRLRARIPLGRTKSVQ
jgi:signal transduction histidine kinase